MLAAGAYTRGTRKRAGLVYVALITNKISGLEKAHCTIIVNRL